MLVHPQFDPVAVAIGPVAVRWYGLMYLIGFALIWAALVVYSAEGWHYSTRRTVPVLMPE